MAELKIYDLIFDPGHGGVDPGAVGLTTKEKDNVLVLAKKTAAHLEATGRFRVKFTREKDKDFCDPAPYNSDLDLRNRVKVANALGGKAFFAFHNNSAAVKAFGNEVYALVAGGDGERLAKTICARMAAQLGMVNRGVKYANWYVCKWTNMPAVLIEYGFINAEEAVILAKMDQAAQAIAQGIGDYFGVSVEAPRKEEEIMFDHAVVYFTDTDFSSARIISRKLGGCAMYCRDGVNANIHKDIENCKHPVIVGGAELNIPGATNCCGLGAPETAILAAQYAQKL